MAKALIGEKVVEEAEIFVKTAYIFLLILPSLLSMQPNRLKPSTGLACYFQPTTLGMIYLFQTTCIYFQVLKENYE